MTLNRSFDVPASWCEICSDVEGHDDSGQGQGQAPGREGQVLGHDTLATLYCVNCRQSLCRRCGSRHTRLRFAADHTVIERGEVSRESVATQGNDCSPSTCMKHHPKPLVVYCRDCDDVGCLSCLSLDAHQGHKWCDVDMAYREVRETLSRHLEQVARKMEECRHAAERQRRSADALEQSLRSISTQLHTELEKLRQDLDRCAEELQSKLQAAEEMKAQMESRCVELEQQTDRMSSFVAQCQQIVDSTSALKVLRSHSELRREATKLVNLETANDLCQSLGVAFIPTSLRQYLPQTDANLVGAVSIDNADIQTDDEDENEPIHGTVSQNQQKGEFYFSFLLFCYCRIVAKLRKTLQPHLFHCRIITAYLAVCTCSAK